MNETWLAAARKCGNPPTPKPVEAADAQTAAIPGTASTRHRTLATVFAEHRLIRLVIPRK